MTSPFRTRPVARLGSPAEIAGVIPLLVGFVPHESVVVVSLRPPRRRVGLALRIDLPKPGGLPSLARAVAAALARDGAAHALVVIYTAAGDTAGALAGQDVVKAIEAGCGVPVPEALLVRDGRWWSYLCQRADCCPAEGTSIQARPDGAVGLLAAEQVLGGRTVLASRAELVTSLAAPVASAAVLRRLGRAAAREDALAAPAARRAQALRGAAALLTVCSDGGTVGVAEAAAFAVSLRDVVVRDEVATWALDEPVELLTLLTQVARHTVAPYDAPVCTLIAWIAYGEGNGALANVALDRALDGCPDYALAVLLRSALDAQVPPAQVRALLGATALTTPRRQSLR